MPSSFPCGEASGQLEQGRGAQRAVPSTGTRKGGCWPQGAPGTQRSPGGTPLADTACSRHGGGCHARNCKGSVPLVPRTARKSTFPPSAAVPSLEPASQEEQRERKQHLCRLLQLRDSVHTAPLPHHSPPSRSQGIWERGRSRARTGFNSRLQSFGAVSQLGAISG